MKDHERVGDVILEFRRIGNTVKVSAVDTVSYVEVSIMAPVTCSEQEMTSTAIQKLEYVLAKQNNQKNKGASTPPWRRKR